MNKHELVAHIYPPEGPDESEYVLLQEEGEDGTPYIRYTNGPSEFGDNITQHIDRPEIYDALRTAAREVRY